MDSTYITEGVRSLIKVVNNLDKLEDPSMLRENLTWWKKDIESAQFICKRLVAAESVQQIMELITNNDFRSQSDK